jgi:prepilin-type N-terminal cleavage/methylation domain-containing protein
MTPTPIYIARENFQCAGKAVPACPLFVQSRCKLVRGFTLAELLMAVWVMSIILAAIATLSFALGSANDSADDTSEIQSRIRYTTMRLGELIRNSKLVCAKWDSSVAIWQADDNGNSQIDPNEIVYIEYDGSNNCLKLISFTPTAAVVSFPRTLGSIGNGQARTWLGANTQVNDVNLINNCSYVTFTTDQPPPFSKRLNLFFGIRQKGVIQNYQLTAYLRCQADYLLDGGQIVSVDDDM